jgi:hypothetical protein
LWPHFEGIKRRISKIQFCNKWQLSVKRSYVNCERTFTGIGKAGESAMNFYPSWIHRIPDIIARFALGRARRPPDDREPVWTCAGQRRSICLGASARNAGETHSSLAATSWIARLREMQEHPDWRWERNRRERIRARIDNLRPGSRRSIVCVDASLQEQIDRVAITGLPTTIQFAPA